MAGIYLHIPFCRQLCGYCDFRRSADLRLMPQVVERMHGELRESNGFITDRTVRTVYFGGGTPSLLHPSELQRFMRTLECLFDCRAVEEVTVEANPDDITPEYVAALRDTAVNRISLGVQSFDDDALRFMRRRHDAAQAVRAVELLQKAGYGNISIDLIFGIDGFGEKVLRHSLRQSVALGVQHVSAYHLTIEPSTRFGVMLARGELRQVDEEVSESEYLMVHRTLAEAGFEHYEVSNYALSGFRSRHNSSYWTGEQYLGVGAGAHSFNGVERRWCEQSAARYAVGVEYGGETLTRRDRLNEYLMTSMRCIEGISLDGIAARFGAEERLRIERLARAHVASGTLVARTEDGVDRLAVAPERFLVSDAVISSFFDV